MSIRCALVSQSCDRQRQRALAQPGKKAGGVRVPKGIVSLSDAVTLWEYSESVDALLVEPRWSMICELAVAWD